MESALQNYLKEHRGAGYQLLQGLLDRQQKFFLRSELLDQLYLVNEELEEEEFLESPLGEVFLEAQEGATQVPWVYIAVRPQIARWKYLRFHVEDMKVEQVSVSDYLIFRERLLDSAEKPGSWPLEIDLGPFNRKFPKMQESRSIGRGVEYLNRRLSSELFLDLKGGDELIFQFLRVHHIGPLQLMLNDQIENLSALQSRLKKATRYLENQPEEDLWGDVEPRLREMGFEPGWGDTVARTLDTMNLLSDVLEAPDHMSLERFLGRIPMIYKIAIISPHGFFGQYNVMGLPDTGGQIVYILDQVRALEKEMRNRLRKQGISIAPKIVVVSRLIPNAGNTTCDQREEHIIGTENAKILRIPFRGVHGEILQDWISRFEVWPYLEDFALEAEKAILSDFMGRPDLIIGNYSDGNLVASLMAQRLKVTQCNIAHALEKSKYLYSALYWRENEPTYHFSCQFTADLIAMNTADFIITSTYQEIAGNGDSVGQYESYDFFTMPGLYRVVNGIDVFDPKFNIVSPGADEEVFFPYFQEERRFKNLQSQIESMIFEEMEEGTSFGQFEDPEKPILFAMSRMDRIKNLAGLTEWYSRSERLRNVSNLLIISGTVDYNASHDSEEKLQIQRMYELYEEFDLKGQVRWLGRYLDKNVSGELYRYLADRRGVFVQPALFEAFGLTVIEAMISGLPTFATLYGGPLEIIRHGISGFHIDPNRGDKAAELIADFLEKCKEDPSVWEQLSRHGVERIKSRYTWKLYAEKMMTLARIYGFWRYVTDLDRSETRRYLELLYGLLYRGQAATLLPVEEE
jgi:sucrose synthase